MAWRQKEAAGGEVLLPSERITLWPTSSMPGVKFG